MNATSSLRVVTEAKTSLPALTSWSNSRCSLPSGFGPGSG